MKSLSFDPMVALYDETRTVDDACLNGAFDYLVKRFPPQEYQHVVEPGIGTGRIAIPLAGRGYKISGVDISREMLQMLAQRLQTCPSWLSVLHQVGDVTALPFLNHSFDLAIAVHLFYFVPNWQQAIEEILRVVRIGGPIILMHTGFGMELPWLMERYKEMSAEHGYCAEHIGARSTREVLTYAQSLDCRIEQIRNCWKWMARIPIRRTLLHLDSRAYSCCMRVPESVHSRIMTGLKSDALDYYGSLDEAAAVPNEIALSILTRN